jgi:hypothetical protein
MKNLIIILISLLFLSSCNKTDETITNTGSKPIITFISPHQNDSIALGETLVIKAQIEHTTELHEYAVQILDANTSKELYYYSHHSHSPWITIVKDWKIENVNVSKLIVKIIAVDHGLLRTEESRSLIVN